MSKTEVREENAVQYCLYHRHFQNARLGILKYFVEHGIAGNKSCSL